MNYYRCSVGSDDYAKAYTYTVNSVPASINVANYFNNNQSLTNENIIIGDWVTGANTMFMNCYNFNGSVKLGANLTNLDSMFYGCNKFNNNISIPANATRCNYMFSNCTIFNSNIVFKGNNYNNLGCSWMMANCVHYNKPFTIPEGTYTCYSMFYNTAFNQTIYIPESVNNCVQMFRYASMRGNIYINCNVEKTSFSGALTSNGDKRINIHYNGYQNLWKGYMTYIIQGVSLSLSTMSDSNGYYNSNYNIYFYNNYYAT